MTATPQTVNRAGLNKQDYVGSASTLCPGCGHDNITKNIINAYFELGIDPFTVAKTSGIGCSSKTPAYFLSQSHGFNAVHGRMPSISTGAKLANNSLSFIGVSGDGDTASIGMGQFCHIVRRNLDMVYIIENNGVYGLTKGQFSATADMGTTLKKGEVNHLASIDLCTVAIQLGCGYVARSYSSDFKQLTPLIKGAISHKGLAVIDVISPCVTFNNHEGSTKSYDAVKATDYPIHEIDYIAYFEQKEVDYKPGETVQVDLPDGSHLFLQKLDGNYDPTDRVKALTLLESAKHENKLFTGLLFVNEQGKDFNTELNLPEKPLCQLQEQELRMSQADFAAWQKQFS